MRTAARPERVPTGAPEASVRPRQRGHGEPLFFGPGDRKLFGWFHAAANPDATATRFGVVLCNPFGYEAVCAHYTMRHLAESLAAAGMPCMRFDYDGTGNSSGKAEDPDRIASWCGSIGRAADTLKELSGAQSISLVGLRLGAMLAAMACRDRDDVSALVALAPTPRGRVYLRELRVRSATEGRSDDLAGMDGLVSSGFRLTAATLAELDGIDLEKQFAGGDVPTLVLDRDDVPQAGSWVEAMQRAGRRVDREQFAGYAGLMTSPHAAICPHETIERTTQWLLAARDAGPAREPQHTQFPTVGSLPVEARLIESATTRIDHGGSGVVESTQFLDIGRNLFGILTEPGEDVARALQPGVAVILLNAGATHHIGPNRMHVSLARSWAQRGAVVLRIDLRGLGDSASLPDQPGTETYPRSALEDVETALSWLQLRYPEARVTLLGICSGAYHALKAAVGGLPVSQAIVINPLTFSWVPGTPLDIDAVRPHEIAGDARAYREKMLNPRSWVKLARGSVDLPRIASVMIRRAMMECASVGRTLMSLLGAGPQAGLESELRAAKTAGVDLRFVFAAGDPGQDLLYLQGGSEARRLAKAGHITSIEGADHVFRAPIGRQRLEQLLEQLVFRRNRPAPGGVSGRAR